MTLPIENPESVGVSGQALDRLSAAMTEYVESGQIAGLVTLISRHGKIVHLEAQGMSYIEGNRAMKPDTVFRMASMTKPITCVALMMLYEEGGFLSAKKTISWINTEQQVLDSFARQAIYFLE